MPAESGTHMIGTIRADTDGTLWVGHGDGADFNTVDPAALRALDPTSLAGKILHIDRDGTAVGSGPWPFCGAGATQQDVCAKVHAKGFRNPFRFQLRADKKIVLGDVGWNTREEIDVVEKGKSYGWPCREGKIAGPGYSDLAACDPYTTSHRDRADLRLSPLPGGESPGDRVRQRRHRRPGLPGDRVPRAATAGRCSSATTPATRSSGCRPTATAATGRRRCSRTRGWAPTWSPPRTATRSRT